MRGDAMHVHPPPLGEPTAGRWAAWGDRVVAVQGTGGYDLQCILRSSLPGVDFASPSKSAGWLPSVSDMRSGPGSMEYAEAKRREQDANIRYAAVAKDAVALLREVASTEHPWRAQERAAEIVARAEGKQ